MDYPLPPRHGGKDDGVVDFANVGGRLTEFRGRRFVRALDNVTVEIADGDRLALLGGNGSGKSTLLKAMGGLLPIAKGTLQANGRVTTLFNTAVGIDPNLSGYANLERLSVLHNLPRSHAARIYDDMVTFTELGGFMHLPVKTYSAGMRTRLGFGFATSLDAEILLVDEVIGAGDASFFERARERLTQRMHSAGIVVLASHSLPILRKFCTRGLVLHRGQVQFVGDIDEAVSQYQLIVQRISRPKIGQIANAAIEATEATEAPETVREPPPSVERDMRPGERFELFATSVRTRPGVIRQSVAARATVASFQFVDEAGTPIDGNHKGFHAGINETNFIYLPGATNAIAPRHARFLFTVPDGVHAVRITAKPLVDQHQRIVRLELRQVAVNAQDDGGLPVARGAEIDAFAAAVNRQDWSAAHAGLKTMLGWPAGEIGYSDIRTIETLVTVMPTGQLAAIRSTLKSLLDSDALPRTALTDRVALGYLWGVVRNYAAVGGDAYLADLKSMIEELTSKLGLFSAPLLAQGMLAMVDGDKAAANGLFRRAAAAEAFDAPLARRFFDVYSLQDYARLVEWGKAAISEAEYQEPPASEIEWLTDPSGLADRPRLLLSGGAQTFLSSAEAALKRLDRTGSGCGIHFHVVNWTSECSRLRDALVTGSGFDLGFSTEVYADARDPTYFATAGFLRAREIMQTLDGPIVLAGITDRFESDPMTLIQALGDADFGFRSIASFMPHRMELPAAIRNTPASRILLRLVEAYMRAFYVADYPINLSVGNVAFDAAVDTMALNEFPFKAAAIA